MAFDLENMTVDYKTMFRMVPSDRLQVARSGVANDLISSLTPGQLANLFPSYYRDQLPDIGQSGGGGSSFGGALSGGTSFGGGGGGSTYSPSSGPAKSVPAEEKAIQELFKKANVGGIQLSGSSKEKAADLTDRMVKDLGISETKAAAIVGNFMHESGDFQQMQEISPTSGRGGYGWAQWTGPRRKNFEKFVADKGLDINSDEANYQFFLDEIQNDPYEKQQFERWKNTDYGNLSSETVAFENAYERAGVKHHGSRIQRAETALQMYEQKIANIESDVNDIKDLSTAQSQFDPSMISMLDGRMQKWYQNANEIQKKNFEEALGKLGVEEFNATMKRQPINNTTLQAELNIPEAYDPKTGVPNNWNRNEGVDPNSEANRMNIVPVETPYGKINVAKDAAAAFGGFYNDLSSSGFPMQNGPGSFNIRRKNSAGAGHNPGGGWSEHSFGNATDIGNQTQLTQEQREWMNANPGKLEQIKSKWGMRSPQGDEPHMEYMGAVSPEAQAQVIEAQAQVIEAKKKAEEEVSATPAVSDPVAAAQSNVQEPSTPTAEPVPPAEAVVPAVSDPVAAAQMPPETPPAAVPSFSEGGTVPMTPGENIAGVNTTTGKVEFMSNDRELYTKDDQGNLRVDPSTIRQDEQAAAPPPEATQKSDPVQPIQQRPQQPMPTSVSDPNFLNTMSSGSMASSPSQLRALNRAKLYGENSGNLVNGHFS